MHLESLQGTWHLQSFQICRDGEWRDWGTDASGVLIYSEDGYMSVAINSSDEKILFYSGTYSLTGDQIVHDVLNASLPSRVGTQMIRTARFKNEELQLSGEASESGNKFLLIWRR